MKLAALLAAIAAPAAAQPYIAGYLNPVTRAFHAQVAVTNTATVPYDGSIDATVTVSVASPIPASQAITCSAEFLAVDTSGHIGQYSVSQAAVRAGSKATCAIVIPYAFQLAANTTYSISYSAFTGSPAGAAYRLVSGPSNPTAPLPRSGSVKLTGALTI